MPYPEIFEYQRWKPNKGMDPAKYLVAPANLRFNRPRLINGDTVFVFPVGVEGFRRSATSLLGLHRYIGDNTTDGVTINREEARIELSGTFPGITAQDNMVACFNILRSIPPKNGLVLVAPGVFEREQYVLPESWDFTHDRDDRSHSIDYVISLVRIDEGKKVPDVNAQTPKKTPANTKTKTKGKAQNTWTVKEGQRTFNQIAKRVYGDAKGSATLIDKNRAYITKWNKSHPVIPEHSLPTFHWPVGTVFRY